MFQNYVPICMYVCVGISLTTPNRNDCRSTQNRNEIMRAFLSFDSDARSFFTTTTYIHTYTHNPIPWKARFDINDSSSFWIITGTPIHICINLSKCAYSYAARMNGYYLSFFLSFSLCINSLCCLSLLMKIGYQETSSYLNSI